jgi:phosphate transport system substrate-binding protein
MFDSFLRRLLPVTLAALLVGLGTRADDKPKADDPPAVVPGAPYRPTEEVKGKLRLVGSKTVGHVASLWAEGFRKHHPQATVEIKCDGSETAFPELTADTPTVGALSRPVTEAEAKQFEAQAKRKLVAVGVCEDAVAVLVHKDNPVESLTPAQLRLLFGREKGAGTVTWGRVGAGGEWAARPVAVQGRTAVSGTRVFFRNRVLGEGIAERPATEHASLAALVKAVAENPAAVAYCRAGGAADGVKVVPLRSSAGAAPEVPSRDPEAAARYPLRRRLSLVVAVPADGAPAALPREFLLYVLSRDGQADTVKDGFTALDRSGLLDGLDRLGLNPVR